MGLGECLTLVRQYDGMFDSTDFADPRNAAGVREASALIAAGLELLADEDRVEWSSASRSARMIELGRLTERVQAEWVRAVGVWDGAGDYAADGALSATAWIAHRVPTTRGDAARVVAAGRMVRRSDRTAKALEAGDITVSHVEQIARTVRRREDIFTTHGDVLVDAGITVTPEAFRECAASWRAKADDEVGARDDPSDDSRDELTLSPTLGGLSLRGWLHPDAGIEILALIDNYDHPDPADGQRVPRSRAQRRAAALVALLLGDRPAAEHHIDVVIDEQTMRGNWPDDLRDARTHVDGYGPVPCSLIRRWLTTAVLRRVVKSGSEILDVGRGIRLATPAQHRALRHRDGGCVVPGCARPPRWTDAHHVIAYLHGGATDLDNLALVRRRHHHMLDHGWTLTRAPDHTWIFNPPTDRPLRRPRTAVTQLARSARSVAPR